MWDEPDPFDWTVIERKREQEEWDKHEKERSDMELRVQCLCGVSGPTIKTPLDAWAWRCSDCISKSTVGNNTVGNNNDMQFQVKCGCGAVGPIAIADRMDNITWKCPRCKPTMKDVNDVALRYMTARMEQDAKDESMRKLLYDMGRPHYNPASTPYSEDILKAQMLAQFKEFAKAEAEKMKASQDDKDLDAFMKKYGMVMDGDRVVDKDNVKPKMKPETNKTPVFYVEYIGQCRAHPDGNKVVTNICNACGGSGLVVTNLNNAANSYSFMGSQFTCHKCSGNGRLVEPVTNSYASGWMNNGWNIRFPEKVLRAYFPVAPVAFDGDFFKALLAAPDINRAYKQLARKYHPDAKGHRHMWDQLSEAYTSLKDPIKRKRYEAGLKFQVTENKKTNEVEFRIPVTCGDVTVEGEWERISGHTRQKYVGGKWEQKNSLDYADRFNVTKILEWKQRVNKRGEIFTARWKGKSDYSSESKPFTTAWEPDGNVEFNVEV